MPFQSEKQRALFYVLERQGKISPEEVKKWESETPKGKLPEHVKKGSKK
jgi:hypothetical protein